MTLPIPATSGASVNTIAMLTEEYGDLPPSFLRFLQSHDGAMVSDNILRGSHGRIGVRGFLAGSDILTIAQSVEGLAADLIPIADDDTGNYICMGSKDHSIYFWDHETRMNEAIANSFEEFIERLDAFDISEPDLEPEVEDIWIKPGFEPKFRRERKLN